MLSKENADFTGNFIKRIQKFLALCNNSSKNMSVNVTLYYKMLHFEKKEMDMHRNREVEKMLKITVKPGEYFTIGDEIKVAIGGRTGDNVSVLIEAPKKYNIVRNKVLERQAQHLPKTMKLKQYYKESGLSEEAKEKIKAIIIEEKRKNKIENHN